MRAGPNLGKLRFEARLASVATWFAVALEALPGIVICAIFVAALFGVTARLFARYGWRTAAGAAGLVGLSLPVRLIGKRGRPALERRAARAWGRYHEHLLTTDTRPPILLLRSFRHSMIARGTKAPLIAQAIRAAVPTGPVITLGDESDIASAGAGTFYINGPDQDWPTLFKACAWASSVVVVVPETTRSLVSEMLALARSNFFGKTLILMPPAGEKPDELFGSPNWKRWTAIREGLGQIGLHLPDYDRYGMAYVPREDLAPARQWQLGRPTASHIGAAVGDVAAHQTVGRASTATLIEVLGIRCDGRRLVPLSGQELQARVASFANRYAPDPTRVVVGSIAESPEALAAAVIMPPVARAPAVASSYDPTRYESATEPSHERVKDNSSTAPSQEPVKDNSSTAPSQEPVKDNASTAPSQEPVEDNSSSALSQERAEYRSSFDWMDLDIATVDDFLGSFDDKVLTEIPVFAFGDYGSDAGVSADTGDASDGDDGGAFANDAADAADSADTGSSDGDDRSDRDS